MKPIATILLCALPLLALACARHHVVERDVGRVDGARSITTNSELEWTVEREPAATRDEQR